VVFGCDSGSGGNDMGIPDMTPLPPDMIKVFDLAAADLLGVRCGMVVCPMNTTCCVEPMGASFSETCTLGTMCGPGTAPALCDGPEDCPMMPNMGCCASVEFQVPPGGGTAMPTTGQAQCNTNCPAIVEGDGMGKTTFKSKLCHSTADCADYVGEIFGGTVKFDGCCYRSEVSFTFCAPDDSSYKTAGGYKCL
jgi:hypothetical protein